MFSEYFIKRPIFASVAAIVITLLGIVAIPSLPIAQYPPIAPPKVLVTATYNGANAEVVESAVTTPLEQAINGVERMKYIQSTSTADGLSQITVTFDQGTDLNEAVVNVQNRINQAQGRIPQEVRATGINVEKESNDIILGIGFFSKDHTFDNLFISNYVDRYVIDNLKRIEGVGAINMFGDRKFAMRLWLDPIKMAARGLSVNDVANAIREQNVEVAAGAVGLEPTAGSQDYQMNLLVKGRLANEDEFNELVLAKGPKGGLVKLKDVGKAELGAEDSSKEAWWQGGQAIGFGVNQLPDANALEVATKVQEALKRMKSDFPKGLDYEIAFDATAFVDESIHEVVKTLFEAIVFVILVIWLFLQNWRTTLIPAITIPVSLLGSFIFMKAFGFSINMLTLFGITLATGLVVDDAIIVVENIARRIEEDKTPPLQAAQDGMREIFGAVIATSLVLIAVFVPVAFFPGTTGKLYEQFALTIAFAIAISTFNAVTLSPTLSALLLSQKPKAPNVIYRGINWFIDSLTDWYNRTLQQVVKLKPLVMAIFIGLMALTVMLFSTLPKGFVPSEDQGYFIIAAQAPEGTSQDYMREVIKDIEGIMLKQEEVNGVFAVNGFSFTGNASNKAIMFVPLKRIGERREAEHSARSIIERVRPQLLGLTKALVIPFEPPAVRGIGNLGGFQFHLQDKQGTAALGELEAAQWGVIGKANQSGDISGAFSTFGTNTPQLKVDIDRDTAKSLGIPLSEIFSTLQLYMGSLYINDFTFNNRIYRVYAQADARARNNPKDIEALYVRSQTNTMVPLNTVVDVSETTGATAISHFNLFRSTEINGAAAPGKSSGQTIATMERIAKETLQPGLGYEWSGISREEAESGSATLAIFGLGILFVYLVLAAQYESWLDPLIIVLSVPLAVLGAVLALKIRGLENDVFAQIGLVMLVGLASKNAILIVEFANQLLEQGRSITEAALEASRLRLRPILMTALSFVFGVIPLLIATGAGAAARHSLGTTVFGGMLVATFLSLYIVPVLFIVFKEGEAHYRSKKRRPALVSHTEPDTV